MRFCGCCWGGDWPLRFRVVALGRVPFAPKFGLQKFAAVCHHAASREKLRQFALRTRGMHLPDPGAKPGTRGANVWFWIPRDRRVTAGVKGLGEQDGRTWRWERGLVTQFGCQSISKQSMGKEGGVCGRSLDKWNHHHRHFALTYMIDDIQNSDNIQSISNPTSLTSNSNTSPKSFPLSAPHHDEPPMPLPARGVRSRRRPTHRRPQRRRQEPAQHANRRPQPGLLLVPLPPRQRHPRRLVSPPLSSPPTSSPTPLSHPPTPLH